MFYGAGTKSPTLLYHCGKKSRKFGLCILCEFLGTNFDDAKSLFLYDEYLKKIIAKLKFSDQTILAKFAAKMLVDNFLKEILEADFIIPVPIHKKRLFKRKYNQSALIAKNIAKVTKTKIRFDILKKIKHTKPQAKLSLDMRFINLQNVFVIKNNKGIEGSSILLIDDVITTGTTISECAKLLKAYNPKKIVALSIARFIL